MKYSKGPNIILWHFSSLIKTFRFGSECSSKHLNTYSERCFMKMLWKSFICRTRLIHFFPRSAKSNSGLSLMSTSLIIYPAIWKEKSPDRIQEREHFNKEITKKQSWRTIDTDQFRAQSFCCFAGSYGGGNLGFRFDANAGMHLVQIIGIFQVSFEGTNIWRADFSISF